MRAPSSVAKETCFTFASDFSCAGADGDVAGVCAAPRHAQRIRRAARAWIVSSSIVVSAEVQYSGKTAAHHRTSALKIASMGLVLFRSLALPVIVLPNSYASLRRYTAL